MDRRPTTAFGVDPTTCGGSSASTLYAFSVPLDSQVGIAPTADDHGYRTVNQSGALSDFGDATSLGVPTPTNGPVVAVRSPTTGAGAWVTAIRRWGVRLRRRRVLRLEGRHALNAPVVGMAPTPDGKGYWLVGADGGVFAFGDAVYYGSMGGTPPSTPRWSGMAATADGGGYWLVGADGGVFAFGDAAYDGSMGGRTC